MKEVIHRKKCTYCKTRFATHPARKIHETMMHRKKLIEDGIIVIGKTTRGSKYHHISTRGRKWKTSIPLVFSTTPHIGSVETVIEPNKSDGTIVMNPSKAYPNGKVYVWSHVHGYCTRDPCIFCGRGDLTDIKREWGIEE